MSAPCGAQHHPLPASPTHPPAEDSTGCFANPWHMYQLRKHNALASFERGSHAPFIRPYFFTFPHLRKHSQQQKRYENGIGKNTLTRVRKWAWTGIRILATFIIGSVCPLPAVPNIILCPPHPPTHPHHRTPLPPPSWRRHLSHPPIPRSPPQPQAWGPTPPLRQEGHSCPAARTPPPCPIPVHIHLCAHTRHHATNTLPPQPPRTNPGAASAALDTPHTAAP